MGGGAEGTPGRDKERWVLGLFTGYQLFFLLLLIGFLFFSFAPELLGGALVYHISTWLFVFIPDLLFVCASTSEFLIGPGL